MCEFAGYLEFSDDEMDTLYKNTCSTGVAAIHDSTTDDTSDRFDIDMYNSSEDSTDEVYTMPGVVHNQRRSVQCTIHRV